MTQNLDFGATAGGERKIASFSIARRNYLDASGVLLAALPDSVANPDVLVAVYRAMVLARAFDERAIQLQRTGKLGTFASSLGQEAVAVGIAAAMQEDDVLVPSFREHGALLWRGVTLTELFLYWGGDERGSNYAKCRHDFPICVPVGSQFPHAAGAALALSMDGLGRAVVAVGGDGATSKGDFYETINIAGVWRLPAVFVINNNQWAISTPVKTQTAAETLAQKAIAAGIPGEQVDGNDAIAIIDAVTVALARARKGEGPTLIEAITYRLSDHTTADDARRYRDDAEVSRHWNEEPVRRLKAWLTKEDLWNSDKEEQLLQESAREVDEAAQIYLNLLPEAPQAMFDHLFAELPEPLWWQREQLLNTRQSNG
jgi:pyruvate dehydrogenase E1 component alpha subunit